MKKTLWLFIPLALIAAYLVLRVPSDQKETVTNTASSISTNPTAEVPDGLSLSVSPSTVLQGNPAEISINGLDSVSTIESLSLDGRLLHVFLYDGKPTALIGIDLRGKTGPYELVLTLEDGQKIEKKLMVGARIITKAPLTIPDKLGGNTPEAEKKLISTLAEEGSIISSIPTSAEMLWSGPFRFPLSDPIVVTDIYGYTRLTGGSTISHKGTDFQAAIGTPVYAMNSGLVRFVGNLRNYGNTVVIDHGLELLTIYMHLSEVNVKVGDTLKKGDFIGKSGDTGYVLGPHLHITVRIGDISVDPMKFMELLGPNQ